MRSNIPHALLCFLFILHAHCSHAQNLIPNPGFEELFTVLEYQWVQPQGAYYHYEVADSTSSTPAHSGKYINGLCMYNTRPNEYLHVKLLKTLEKGKIYRFDMQTRLMRAKSANALLQKYIGVHFGNKNFSTHIPGDLHVDPQLALALPDSNRFEWFQMTDTFEAKGSEEYLTIGYFAKTQLLEEKERSQQAFFDELENKYSASKQRADTTKDMSWLYMSPADQKEYLKQQKKESRKKGHKHAQNSIDPSEYSEFPPGPSFQDASGAFAVRYYFDDLCLIELDTTKEDCKPENLPETLEAGKKISLRNVFFASDSATLKSESILQLEALERLMKQHPSMVIEIHGHTDNVGDRLYNQDLSLARAETVKDWLVLHGVGIERISAKGFGESQPIETNETEGGRARNRRVLFLITSM